MIKESKTMREIHEIMEHSYEERNKMSDDEIIKDINKSAEQFMKKYNLKLRREEKKVLQKI